MVIKVIYVFACSEASDRSQTRRRNTPAAGLRDRSVRPCQSHLVLPASTFSPHFAMEEPEAREQCPPPVPSPYLGGLEFMPEDTNVSKTPRQDAWRPGCANGVTGFHCPSLGCRAGTQTQVLGTATRPPHPRTRPSHCPRAACPSESRSPLAGASVQWFQELIFIFKRSGQAERASGFISLKPRSLSESRGLLSQPGLWDLGRLASVSSLRRGEQS